MSDKLVSHIDDLVAFVQAHTSHGARTRNEEEHFYAIVKHLDDMCQEAGLAIPSAPQTAGNPYYEHGSLRVPVVIALTGALDVCNTPAWQQLMRQVRFDATRAESGKRPRYDQSGAARACNGAHLRIFRRPASRFLLNAAKQTGGV